MATPYVGEIRLFAGNFAPQNWAFCDGSVLPIAQYEVLFVLIGTTYGKYIARAEDIPLVRVGFPILDRAVHPLMPITGYRGCLRLIEMISNTLLDRRDRDCLDEDYELVL